MTLERLLLGLSLAGNVVLVVALFFKSALNEIVVHWYKARVSRREKCREVLQGLNKHVTDLRWNHFQLMVALGLMQMATTPEDKALAEATFDEARRGVQQTNEFLEQNELEFPQSVRGMIADLRQATQLPANVVTRVMTRDEIMQRSDAVMGTTERIKAEVARLVA